MGEPEASIISLSWNELVVIGTGVFGGIAAMWRFIGFQAKAVEKSNAQQISLLRAHIQALETSRVQDRKDLQALSGRAQELENRSFSFLETMSARQAQTTERLVGLTQHTVTVLDEVADSLHRLHATDTALHVALKNEVRQAREKSKHLSGEHKANG